MRIDRLIPCGGLTTTIWNTEIIQREWKLLNNISILSLVEHVGVYNISYSISWVRL